MKPSRSSVRRGLLYQFLIAYRFIQWSSACSINTSAPLTCYILSMRWVCINALMSSDRWLSPLSVKDIKSWNKSNSGSIGVHLGALSGLIQTLCAAAANQTYNLKQSKLLKYVAIFCNLWTTVSDSTLLRVDDKVLTAPTSRALRTILNKKQGGEGDVQKLLQELAKFNKVGEPKALLIIACKIMNLVPSKHRSFGRWLDDGRFFRAMSLETAESVIKNAVSDMKNVWNTIRNWNKHFGFLCVAIDLSVVIRNLMLCVPEIVHCISVSMLKNIQHVRRILIYDHSGRAVWKWRKKICDFFSFS